MTGAFGVGKGKAPTQFPHDRGGSADQYNRPSGE